MCANPIPKSISFGLFLLRLGIGAMFILHGYPKIIAGVEEWTKIGQVLEIFGITFGFAVWGCFAALAELLGGLLLIIGMYVRRASFFMLIVMFIAAYMHIDKNSMDIMMGIKEASPAITAGVVFLSLIFTGGGNFRIPALFCCGKKCKKEPQEEEKEKAIEE
jgi:putative oxidoreductase